MGISRFFVNFEILLLLLERKSKGSIFLCLIFFVCFQNFSAQEQGVIYVIGDAQIVGLNENVSVVVYNNDKDIQLSQITEVKKVANKRKTTKKTEINVLSDRKKISKKVNTKPKYSFQNTKSDQSIVLINGFNHNRCSTANPTFSYKGELEFHYKVLNVPIHIHLEKSYEEDVLLSSNFSKFFFSRPPPVII